MTLISVILCHTYVGHCNHKDIYMYNMYKCISVSVVRKCLLDMQSVVVTGQVTDSGQGVQIQLCGCHPTFPHQTQFPDTRRGYVSVFQPLGRIFLGLFI